jgi:hypothetical protein
MTTTTVAASATSGCANGDTASILAGTTVPTQSALQRAWGFGISEESSGDDRAKRPR